MTYSQISLTAKQLIEKSKSLTGISHIEDVDIHEALDQLLASLNTEAQLSEEGAKNAEQRILRVLSNRLLMLRDFEAHPEIEDQEIKGPLFISGLPRTGSTKLQKMLAASGDFCYNKLWHVFSLSLRTGARNEDPAPRIADADEFVHWFDHQSPEAKYTHHFQTCEPEEECFVHEHFRFGSFMLAFYEVPSFLQWLAINKDPVDEYRFLKQALQYMQWQRYDGENKPWLLKYPFYMGTENLLLEVMPDARFVVPHRDLTKIAPSGASLLRAYRKAYSDTDYSDLVGPMLLGSYTMGSANMVETRKSYPELPVLDVSYVDVVKNAEVVMEKIYDFAGMTLSDEAREVMRQWEQDNQQHKQGSHKYSLEEFGLSEEAINEGCARYIDYFSEYL